MTYEHFLCTRFNISLYGKSQKVVGGNPIVPEEWMQSRMVLWERYCVPSVYNQSNQNFTWLVVFDPKTPKSYIERATAILHPKHEVLFGTNFRSAIKERIGKPKEDRLITSRLDCDDALHGDYIKRVQDFMETKGKTGILSLPVGWVWDIRKHKLYHCRYPRNPFLTLIEKPQNKVHTVLAHRHTKISDMFRVHRLEGGHNWLQIVHGENLANYCHGDQVAESKLVKSEFGI